jgi:hypothetical protein
MSRHLLDARIRAHETIALADAALAKGELRRSRLAWLERLVRTGHPLPDTPEGVAEDARIYEQLDRGITHPDMHTRTGRMDWDGIWRNR